MPTGSVLPLPETRSPRSINIPIPPTSSRHSRHSQRLHGPSPRSPKNWLGSVDSLSVVQEEKQTKSWVLRLPLKTVIVASLCFFTVAPAITLWLLSWQSGSEGLDTMQKLGQSSLEDVSLQLRSLLITSASDSVTKVINGAENAMNLTLNQFLGDGSLAKNGSGVGWDAATHYMPYTAFVLRTNPLLSMFMIGLYTNMTTLYNGVPRTNYQSFTYANLGWDITTAIYRSTLYLASTTLNANQNESSLRYFVVDQLSGTPIFTLMQRDYGNITTTDGVNVSDPLKCLWSDSITFNVNLGIPMIILECQVPFQDRMAAFDVAIYTNMYTMSIFLKSLLTGPKERLFVSFRNVMGDLVGASHGKYFSHSDIDYTTNNPLTNPPPVETFKKFTALNSTDVTIQQSAVWMIQNYRNWGNIPEINIVLQLNGEAYWVASKHITSAMDLRLEVYLLVDRESRMGPIERTKESTLADIASTNRKLIIILCVVVLGALAFALMISYVLTRSLGQLAFGMDMLAMLEFEDQLNSMLSANSRFTEVSKCETSFVALERGLKAFVKYVPRDVVKMMLTGEMDSGHIMTRRIVTILFMDIAGFSTMCEKIPPDSLNKLTMDYLQSMCQVIVASGGTLDKFIGDCIMAMWNAPHRLKRHEAAACSASLEMQSRLMKLCELWTEEDLPEIRFRIGINTDRVLVGNFGCEYRISYTCLGDGVNLASRLEAANKPFGTVVLVSGSTKARAGSHFTFRKIGHITVPGKAQVCAIYELLFQNRPRSESVWAGPSATNEPGLKTQRTQYDDEEKSVDLMSDLIEDKYVASSEVYFHWEMVRRDTLMELTALYEKGVEQFLKGDLDTAEKYFGDARHVLPSDGACKFLLEQCRQGKDPDKEWDGVLRFDKKG